MGERREDMDKLKKQKHDHTFTDKLKGWLFALIMLAPFIAIAIECLFMIQNPNAVNGYTGTPQDLFYNAVNNITTKSLFNWVEDTGIYTGINAMFTGLEFDTTTNPIAILCGYWLLNTGVYIVIDIVIWCFTKITHMLVNE